MGNPDSHLSSSWERATPELSELTGEDSPHSRAASLGRIQEHETFSDAESVSSASVSESSGGSSRINDNMCIRPTPSYYAHQQRAAAHYQQQQAAAAQAQQQQQQQQHNTYRSQSYARQMNIELESINESSQENESSCGTTSASSAMTPPDDQDPHLHSGHHQSMPKARSWRLAAMRRSQTQTSPSNQGDDSTVTSFFSLSSFRISVPSSLSSGSGSYSSSTWTSDSESASTKSREERSHHSVERTFVQIPHTLAHHQEILTHHDATEEIPPFTPATTGSHSTDSKGDSPRPASTSSPIPEPRLSRLEAGAPPPHPRSARAPTRREDFARADSGTSPSVAQSRRKVRSRIFGRDGSSRPPRLQPRSATESTSKSALSATDDTKKTRMSQASSFTSFTASTSHQSSDDDGAERAPTIPTTTSPVPAVHSSSIESSAQRGTVKRTNSSKVRRSRGSQANILFQEEAKVEIDREAQDLETGLYNSMHDSSTTTTSSAAKMDPIERERQDRMEIERILREAAQEEQANKPKSILRNPGQVLIRFSSGSTCETKNYSAPYVVTDDKRSRYVKSRAWALCAPVRTKTDTCITLAFVQSLLAFIAVIIYYEVTWDEIKYLLTGQSR